MINEYMYFAEWLVSGVDRIRTMAARCGSRSLEQDVYPPMIWDSCTVVMGGSGFPGELGNRE